MRDPVINIDFKRRSRTVTLYPNDATAQRHMTSLLAAWCEHDPSLQYRSSRCGCGTAPGMWVFDAGMIAVYGPLPFTSFGRPIRWRWWHTLGGRSSFTVTRGDLPEGEPEA